MNIGELFVSLGIDADEKGAKSFFNALQEGKNILLGVAAAAVGTSLSVGALMDKAFNTSISLSNFNAETGLSTDMLQKWQHVMEAAGGSSEETEASLRNLSKGLMEMKAFGTGALVPVARYLHLEDYKKPITNAFELITALQSQLKKLNLNPQQASWIMQQSGLTGPWAKMFQMDFKKWSNPDAVIPKAWIERTVELNAKMKHLGETITYDFASALNAVNPQLQEFIDRMQKLLTIHGADIQSGVKAFADVFNNLSKDMGKVFDLMDKLGGNKKGVDKFKMWAQVFTDAVLLLSPVAFVLTAIKDALVVIDDVMNTPGSWLDKLKGMPGILEKTTLGQATKPLWRAGQKTGEFLAGGGVSGAYNRANMPNLEQFMTPSTAGPGLANLLSPSPAFAGAGAGGGQVTFNNTQNINSNATDPAAVARAVTPHTRAIVQEEFGRQLTLATQQLGVKK